MTSARKILIPKGSPGTFHCVSRCVRRAFLCGEDRLTGRSFEHRRQWVEDRIHELAGIFGVAIWGYAVMSNHLHVVVQILPEVVSRWSNAEVVARWMRLYPRQDQNPEMRAETRVRRIPGWNQQPSFTVRFPPMRGRYGGHWFVAIPVAEALHPRSESARIDLGIVSVFGARVPPYKRF